MMATFNEYEDIYNNFPLVYFHGYIIQKSLKCIVLLVFVNLKYFSTPFEYQTYY